MHRGYIKAWRKISDNPLWTEEKFTRGQAWFDLLMLANHKDGHIRVRGIKVPVLRGQCGWSEVALADRWGWSRGKVRRFLKELETVQQIEQQKNNVTSIINITNYREYQGNGTQCSTANGTANGQQTDTNKNVKNVKNKNKPLGGGGILKNYDYPDWLDKEQWQDFHRMRSRIKKPITTKQTITRLLTKLKKLMDNGYSQEILFSEAIDHCWQSFYPPKGNTQEQSNPLPEITEDLYGT
jgi:hypothetical protein